MPKKSNKKEHYRELRESDLFYAKDAGYKTKLQQDTYRHDIKIVKSANLSPLIHKIERKNSKSVSKSSFSNNVRGFDQQHIIGM